MSYDRSKMHGKISLLTTFLGVGVLLVGLLVDIPHANKVAMADTAQTSVTVLNTPPQWTILALEVPESSTSSPTNTGSNVGWQAVAYDTSNDDYYLLICKTSATPTANNLAAPECAGGSSNRWARSARIASNATASISYTAQDADPETNNWYGFICDHNATSYCNATFSQGTGTGTSPFKVNHRPTFTAFSVTSSISPGGIVGWSSTSSDPDTLAGDTVQLFVCKGQTFTGSDCGASGTWCSSGASSTNPFCYFYASSTWPDAYYSAYGYIRDNYGHVPSAGQQGTNQRMTVNNVTPSIAGASVSLLDTDDTGPLTLTSSGTTTPGFEVRFTVTDQNSCVTASSTDEIMESFVNVYRSGVTSSGCDTSGEYNANNCYPGSINYGTWNLSCTASSTSCLGSSDADVIVQCTFPLWFHSESTDGTGVSTDPIYFAQNWLASAQAADDNGASSTLVESTSGTELTSFLAYDVATTSISYGGLQPGQSVDPVSKITDLQSTGNVGLDQTLYGSDMCPTYPSCSGNATSTIFVNNQKYASSTLSYATAATLLANPGAEMEINVQKSTTSVPAFKITYWGIQVPLAITLSGDYIGQNTLIGITGESSAW